MLLSKKLLTYFVPQFKSVSNADIDKASYNLGLVLEQVIEHPKLENIYVGKILKIENVKNSSKLHYATDEVINKKKYNIICANHKACYVDIMN